LTPFGSGLFVAPNLINFNFVFANLSFANNPSIYIALLVIYAAFILLLAFSRYRDTQDTKKLGSLALADNDQDDKYVYEIVTFTGMKNGASCDSKVSLCLFGDRGETDIRQLTPAQGSESNRKTFRSGAIDSFVLTTRR
jgi:hypothetical protein